MPQKIITISDREFKINGKPVYLGISDKWVARNLTPEEMKTAFNHIKSIENH